MGRHYFLECIFLSPLFLFPQLICLVLWKDQLEHTHSPNNFFEVDCLTSLSKNNHTDQILSHRTTVTQKIHAREKTMRSALSESPAAKEKIQPFTPRFCQCPHALIPSGDLSGEMN